jgi:hypothetical protein
MAESRMLHVAVNAIQLYRYTIQVKDLVTYFGFLESEFSRDYFFRFAGGIN